MAAITIVARPPHVAARGGVFHGRSTHWGGVMVRRSWSNFDAPRRRPPVTAAPVWRRRRRGVAALLAMLYLVIFSTLALGFYSAVTTAAQVAQNDERVMNAQVATESGLQ